MLKAVIWKSKRVGWLFVYFMMAIPFLNMGRVVKWVAVVVRNFAKKSEKSLLPLVPETLRNIVSNSSLST